MSAAAEGAPGGLTVDAAIDRAPLSSYQVGALIMCATILFLDGYDIQTMSLVVPPLMTEWGLERAAFGPALSAANWGVLLASFLLGPLGDYVGRKPVTLISLLVVAVSTFGATTADGIGQLTVWRFVTGLGLGACMPNAYALATELAPARMRSAVLVAMASAVAAGALLAGVVAPWLMAGGWRMVFYAGAALPLIACVVLAIWLPESPRLLAARKWGDPRIGRFLARVLPGTDPAGLSPAPPATAARAPVAALFERNFLLVTLLLWTSYTLVAFVLYLLIGWLPALLDGAGWPLAAAQRGGVMIQLGGILGGIAYAIYVRRGPAHYALAAAMALAVVSLSLFWFAPPTYLVWGAILVALGAGVSGGMFALIAVAGGAYPAAIRATGLSYMVGVSRFAAAVAPLVGGAMLGLGLSTVAVLSFLVIPIALAAVASWTLPKAAARV